MRDYLHTKQLGQSSTPQELERAIKKIEKEMNTISIKSERGGNQLIELIEEKIRLQ